MITKVNLILVAVFAAFLSAQLCANPKRIKLCFNKCGRTKVTIDFDAKKTFTGKQLYKEYLEKSSGRSFEEIKQQIDSASEVEMTTWEGLAQHVGFLASRGYHEFPEPIELCPRFKKCKMHPESCITSRNEIFNSPDIWCINLQKGAKNRIQIAMGKGNKLVGDQLFHLVAGSTLGLVRQDFGDPVLNEEIHAKNTRKILRDLRKLRNHDPEPYWDSIAEKLNNLPEDFDGSITITFKPDTICGKSKCEDKQPLCECCQNQELSWRSIPDDMKTE